MDGGGVGAAAGGFDLRGAVFGAFGRTMGMPYWLARFAAAAVTAGESEDVESCRGAVDDVREGAATLFTDG